MTNTVNTAPNGRTFRLAWRIAMVMTFVTLCIAATQVNISNPRDQNRGLLGTTNEGEDLNAKINGLTSEQISQLRADELAQFITEPLDTVALRNLTTLEALAKKPHTEQLAAESATRTYRDPQNQVLAIHYLMQREKFDESLERLDGLLRARPQLSNNLFPILVSITENKKAASPITTLLMKDPPWRMGLLNFMIGRPGGTQQAYNLLTMLRTAKDPVRLEELRAILKKFTETKNYDAAYFVWLDFLSDAELQRVAHVFDGEFSLTPHNLFFDWTITPKKNSSIQISTRPSSPSDKALKIDFYGFAEHFAQVRQILKLGSGSYEFEFESYAKSYKSDGGLQWRVRCADSPVVIGQSEVIGENAVWRTYGFKVQVPEEDCRTQILDLESASKAKLDKRMVGQIYFDNFVATPTEL